MATWTAWTGVVEGRVVSSLWWPSKELTDKSAGISRTGFKTQHILNRALGIISNMAVAHLKGSGQNTHKVNYSGVSVFTIYSFFTDIYCWNQVGCIKKEKGKGLKKNPLLKTMIYWILTTLKITSLYNKYPVYLWKWFTLASAANFISLFPLPPPTRQTFISLNLF